MFSEHETLVLKIIGRKKMTIGQIAEEFYKTKDEILDRDVYIASVIRRIIKKCDHNKLDWTLVGKGAGRGGKTVWKENRR